MRVNQAIEFNLILFTLWIRQIEKRTLMLQGDLTRNNGATTSESQKKRARTIFGARTKSAEKYDSGYGKRSRAKPWFLLGW